MYLETVSVRGEVQDRVVQRSSRALVSSHDQENIRTTCHVAQALQVWTGDLDGVLCQQAIGRLGGRVIPQRRTGRNIQPHRVTGQPALGKGNHLRALPGGFLDQSLCTIQAGLEVEEYGWVLDNADG